jgi:hypothetical protein
VREVKNQTRDGTGNEKREGKEREEESRGRKEGKKRRERGEDEKNGRSGRGPERAGRRKAKKKADDVRRNRRQRG